LRIAEVSNSAFIEIDENSIELIETELLNRFGFSKEGSIDVNGQLKIFSFMKLFKKFNMEAIKLPVLFLTGNDLQLTELGIKQDEDCEPEIRTVLFYQITALSPYFTDDNEYTCIHSANQNFICPKQIKEVETIIRESRKSLKE
jgi:hypothetical protein